MELLLPKILNKCFIKSNVNLFFKFGRRQHFGGIKLVDRA